jgi:peptidoglycan endopeptidase LytE
VRIVALVIIGVGALGVALAAATPAGAATLYTVTPHDTLYSIARRFGVPVSSLIEANDLRDPSKLRIGQLLTIPTLVSPVRVATGPAAPPSRGGGWGAEASAAGSSGSLGSAADVGSLIASRAPAPTAPAASGSSYVVRPGDTLYHVARTHGVTVAELQDANHLGTSDTLHVGQALVIPGAAVSADAPETPAPLGGLVAVSEPAIATSDPASVSGARYGGTLINPARAIPNVETPPPPLSTRAVLLARRTVSAAMQYLGTPYVWGGTSRAGVDCSGLVYLVYAPYVPTMPRLSYDQWGMGLPVGRGDLAPGDLVFFDTDGSGASHVGIYIGDGRFVHSSSGAHRVVVDDLAEPYYLAHYLGARRVL